MSYSLAQKGVAESRWIKALGMAGGDHVAALAFAQGQSVAWCDTPETGYWLKSAVSAMASGDPGGLATPTALRNYILETVQPRALVDRLTDLRRVPLNVSFPAITTSATAHMVGEGIAKPLSRFSAATLQIQPRKFVADTVTTAELLRYSGSVTDQSLGRSLGRSLVATLDQNFIDPNLSTSVTFGATTFTSSGASLAAIDADLKLLLGVFEGNDDALNTAVFVLAPRTAAYLAALRTSGVVAFPNINLRTGGNIWGIPLLISAGLRASGSPGETEIVLLDASQVAFGDDGQFEISIAKDASVQMDDAPTSTATQTISLFQSNLCAIRAERFCGFARAGTVAAAVLDDVIY